MKPTAVFEWRMPSRAQEWVRAWNAQTATYDEDYVSPKQWPVIVDATKSKGGGFEIVFYRWEIKALNGAPFSLTDEDSPVKIVVATSGQPASEANLAAVFSKTLPRLGQYSVTLTVTNENGEKSAPSSRIIHAQDLLVVSIGDSMASGEGNPDQSGSAVLDQFDPAFPDNPVWTDKRCHRSRRSGHALAARDLEWKHRSVTFLSFACSGARMLGGVVGTYDGFDAPSGPHDPLPSQIDAVANAIGDKRDVDILLVTGGLNDLGVGSDGFSSVIKAFAIPNLAPGIDSDTAKENVTFKLKNMPHVYDRMAWELSRRLHNRLKRVYVTEYPFHIFQPRRVGLVSNKIRQGCGALSAITFGEGDFLFEKGRELGQIIRDAARRHDAHFITGIKSEFEGHGYCDDTSWYVSINQSLFNAGTIDGTIHPNGSGHKTIAGQIVQNVVQPVREITHRPKKVTVIFEKIKVIAPSGTPAARVTLRANGQELIRQVGTTFLNKEVILPEKDSSVSFIVDDGLSGRFVEVSGNMRLFKSNPVEPGLTLLPISSEFSIQFDSKAKYGAGAHERKGTDERDLEVRYRILVEDAPPPKPLTIAPATDVRVTIVFESIKVIAPGTDGVKTLQPVVLNANGIDRSLDPVMLNRKIRLPEKEFTLTFIVDDGQAEPLFLVSGRTVLPKKSPEDPGAQARSVSFLRQFGRKENYGDGAHVQGGPGLTVNYRISTQKIGGLPEIAQ